MIKQMERSKEKDCSQLLKEVDVLKAIYLIKRGWNDLERDTIATYFKRCGFVDNTAKNLVKELFDAIVDELGEIDVNNEESHDDNDNNKMDFHAVPRKVFNYSINELIEAESLLEITDDAKINWEAITFDIIEALEEKEKAESENERGDVTHDYSTNTLILNFATASNRVTYLQQFLKNKGLTDVVQDLSKVESKLVKYFVSSNKKQPKH